MSAGVPDRAAYDNVSTAVAEPIETVERVAVATNAMVEIEAPASLPEGYTFDAEANGRPFTVTVPPGGVEKGQKFRVPLPSVSMDSLNINAPERSNIPVGHWRDDLCDCFRFGALHPVCWMAYCFPTILASQVMTRMSLNWLGGPVSAAEAASTFKKLLILFFIYWIIGSTLSAALITSKGDPHEHDNDFDWDGDENQPVQSKTTIGLTEYHNLWHFVFVLFGVFIATRTRYNIRERYAIPEQNCRGCEDVCCSCFCHCCVLAQMARHTGDYEAHTAMCCTENGLPSHVPNVV
eukprot:CAMPEP_0118696612 /NCGR_PEP_ID=MMETSP0800-20121206/13956_1 /TAXON_ID=210618 ORGANISM="Striatella unipunctata, Strain CCMP2910" /NCGR_SAMPLE_ID=MMETSP0800 /ASSEMBLY_ACC=CAM_ASM_000638 /LENGTH=292 /DNA_ID=CAMNT_0006595769 /DNA_START=161 /DNA_END=1039 /DNA_ORIENTATION=+